MRVLQGRRARRLSTAARPDAAQGGLLDALGRAGWRPFHGRRVLAAVLVAPVLAQLVGLTINADVGAGPVDVANVGAAEWFGVSVGTGASILGLGYMVVGTLGGHPPGPATFLGFPFFAVGLTAAVAWAPEPTGALAWLQFLAALVGACSLVATIVALDVGIAPPEALMLALRRWTSLPLGPLRVVQDVAMTAGGVALGATAGLGTLVVAVGFGPLLATLLPGARRVVDALVPIRAS